jgi:hypothetical protein
MTLTAPRPANPATPASRSARLVALVVPGALLLLGSGAVASMAGSHAAIVHALHLLVALH